MRRKKTEIKEIIQSTYEKEIKFIESEEGLSYLTKDNLRFKVSDIKIDGAIKSIFSISERFVYIDSLVDTGEKIEIVTLTYNLETGSIRFISKYGVDNKKIKNNHLDYLKNKSILRLKFVTGLLH